ncbi:hypothetical protein ABT008_28275 [Micromonospora sp. NPDC002389]|uniref:hypothetical protein n=1 Tax=Micromonospora sp. NPDC002389 TaxID=3154272 RepID=UPI0033180474
MSSKKYTSAERRVCADGQVRVTVCSPVFGQVPQHRFVVSLETMGSMPSLTAATDHQGDVSEAVAVAERARLSLSPAAVAQPRRIVRTTADTNSLRMANVPFW